MSRLYVKRLTKVRVVERCVASYGTTNARQQELKDLQEPGGCPVGVKLLKADDMKGEFPLQVVEHCNKLIWDRMDIITGSIG